MRKQTVRKRRPAVEGDELHFLLAEKRALERLNPPYLSCGSLVNDTPIGQICCAAGAFAVAMHKHTARVEQKDLRKFIDGWALYPYARPLQCDLVGVNEDFRPASNTVTDMRARYVHVYNWVLDEIKKLDG